MRYVLVTLLACTVGLGVGWLVWGQRSGDRDAVPIVTGPQEVNRPPPPAVSIEYSQGEVVRRLGLRRLPDIPGDPSAGSGAGGPGGWVTPDGCRIADILLLSSDIDDALTTRDPWPPLFNRRETVALVPGDRENCACRASLLRLVRRL